MQDFEQSILFAGFWRRFIAGIIDFIILIINFILFIFIINSISSIYIILNYSRFIILSLVFFIGFHFAAKVILESSYTQGTLGKILLKIKVTGLDGHKISLLKSFVRSLSKIISFILLCIGFLIIGFTKKKQGIHDKISKCLIIQNEKKDKGENVIYSGFWRRLIARIIDILIILMISVILFLGFIFIYDKIFILLDKIHISKFAFIILFVTSFLYSVLFEISKLQATPGKLLFRIKVAGLDGEKTSLIKVVLRYITRIFSIITLGLGFIIIMFYPKKQGLHDVLSGCIIIKSKIKNNIEEEKTATINVIK